MAMSAEGKRDETVAAILAAGGQVMSVDALADAANPHVVVAYRVHAGASDPDTLARVLDVQEATERDDTAGLVPWVPEPDQDAEGVGWDDGPTD